MSSLFAPIHLRSLTLDNRVMVAPMCHYSCVDGLPHDWHVVHLGSLAVGSPGLLCLEATAVSPEARITPSCLGLWSAAHEAAFKPLLARVRAVANTRLAIQLGHAGRKASCATPWNGGRQLREGAWTTLAPSALGHYDTDEPPRAMDESDLSRVRQEFVAAAERAVRLGFDAIELHAAHGYLLHQFLSPVANQRTDQYGGSLAQRMAYPLEVFDAVRAAVPAGMPVGVRVSATDWLEHTSQASLTLAETIIFAAALKARGCDWLDVSTGGISPQQQVQPAPGYQLPHARAIRQATGITTMAVGMINTPAQAEGIIARGDADMIAIARAFMMNPRWMWSAAAELGATLKAPAQLWRATSSSGAKIFDTGA